MNLSRYGCMVAVLIVAGQAPAQCLPQWQDGPTFPTTAFGVSVNALTTWDPDGAGSSPSLLVAAGSNLGQTLPPNIHVAAHNGTSWVTLGNGLNGTVRALAVYNGVLYAGGEFNMFFGQGGAPTALARFNGTNWENVGTQATSGPVHALLVHQGELYIAGNFSTVGGVFSPRLARWNGAVMQTVSLSPLSAEIFSLCEYGGDLVVGGRFGSYPNGISSTVARTNGMMWTAIPGAPNTFEVLSMCVFGNELVVGGNFFSQPGTRIAAWNRDTGQWRTFGSGFVSSVKALTAFEGSLYAGGSFAASGAQVLRGIGRWTGSAWVPIGMPGQEGVSGNVNAFLPFQGRLMVGGDFSGAGPRLDRGVATIGCCRANWNGVDGLDSQDFFDYLEDFLAGEADFNGVEGTDSQDFFDFLDAFFTGC